MAEDGQGEYSQELMERPKDGVTINDALNMSGKNLSQVKVEDGSFFPSLEDEVIGVQHLLAEPNCNDFGDDVLGFNAFNHHKCFACDEFSAVEYDSTKPDSDALSCGHNLLEKVKEFSDEALSGTDIMVLDVKNNISDTCEDYLLDTEFVDEASHPNPVKGSAVGNMHMESKSMVSEDAVCVAEVPEVSIACIPVLDSACQNSSLPDNMTIDESVVVAANEKESEMILPTSDQCSQRVSTSFKVMSNLKGRPGVNYVEERNENRVSLKASSSENRNALFSFSELREEETVLVMGKRSRKPTRRYIEESLEQHSGHHKKRRGNSNACPNPKVVDNGSYKKHSHKGFRAKHFVYQKESFRGACIQVPFGEPVQGDHSKKKVLESEGCKDSSLLSANADSDADSFSTESQNCVSEEDYSTGTKSQKGKTRRKHHMYWSLSEVLKLVEGVSMYGVGRWTEIKKLMFRSSANRTSVDLKDKWRNLLRASCPHMRSKREVESRRKHSSQVIPPSILHRIRELAAMHPYPRERKTQVLQTASVASPIPSKSCDGLVPLSTAVRV
ncbi:uncharacterized protein LOC127800930 [Diospyros lotus]|uniref:uncharacterized protein LOC127800930 n=1 Tax=Diospyros lotus TaxID=55363 RepID=UPI00225822F2|nr:uncharacterized protein LOC127800930 [Diospyros lotus]